MSSNSPMVFVAVITAVGAMIWIWGAHFLINSPVVAARRGREESGRLDTNQERPSNPTTISGRFEVEGTPASLSLRLGASLAHGAIGFGIPIEIQTRRDDLLEFTTMGQPARPRGEIRLRSAASGRTTIEYEVKYRELARFLRFGWVLQAAGLVFLAVGFWIVRTYVIPSPNLALRAQWFQMFQVGHFLWPPFMLGSRYRASYIQIRRQMDSMIKNLPHAMS